ncbi:MAG: PIG-L family deacetylase [Deltaproteobacteria bacterium]|nr:PIG-L family deacetylase [Deltaproteobacteria bacterium]
MADKKTKKLGDALVIVAHPDDEVLWTGGYIMRHHEYEWKIIAVCFGAYQPRNRAFVKSCHLLNVYKYEHLDFNSNFKEEELKSRLACLSFNDLALVITHNEINGEYDDDDDHKKVGRIVNEMAKRADVKKLLNFSYKNFQYPAVKIDASDPTRFDDGSQEFSAVHKEEKEEVDLLLFLTHDELARKLYILREIYLEQRVDFRNLSWPCPNPEAFKVIKSVA